VSFISKKYAVPIGHGNSFFGHGKVVENHCSKRVVTLCSSFNSIGSLFQARGAAPSLK